jgi:hypothetical protein
MCKSDRSLVFVKNSYVCFLVVNLDMFQENSFDTLCANISHEKEQNGGKKFIALVLQS